MRWQNVETPTFAGSAGSAGEPAVVETMQLIDRDGNEVAAFTKAVDGTIASTVDGGAVKPILSAVLQSDFPKTNDTLSNVTDLTLNLEAGKWYRVTGQFSILCSVGGGVVDFDGGTATAIGLGGYGFGTSLDDDLAHPNALSSFSSTILGMDLNDTYASFDFTVQVNAGGTLIPRFAQAATDASPSTLLKYSTIQAVAVTPD